MFYARIDADGSVDPGHVATRPGLIRKCQTRKTPGGIIDIYNILVIDKKLGIYYSGAKFCPSSFLAGHKYANPFSITSDIDSLNSTYNLSNELKSNLAILPHQLDASFYTSVSQY
jgi:hypothetical protein